MPVEFWFEFASTYSYPAALRVEAGARAAGVPLLWRAFLLGPIFQQQGWNDSPFNLYPVKGRYMWRDLARICAELSLPLRQPSRFPRGSLPAARVACRFAGEPWLPDFVRAVYRANFAEDRDISGPAVIEVCLDALGQPGARRLEEAQTPESKERLRAQSQRAVELGIFGAPSPSWSGARSSGATTASRPRSPGRGARPRRREPAGALAETGLARAAARRRDRSRVFVAFAASMYVAGEQTEVAVLRSFDADGTPHGTKLWVVDDGAATWVRVARPERRWLGRLEGEPYVELTRHGVARGYRATPMRDAETRARVDRLMAEKYGRADWWYGIVVRTQPIPVRLDPEPVR